MLIISESDVLELLDWNSTFAATEAALASVTKGRVFQKARLLTRQIGNDKNVFFTMPGHVADDRYGAWACKLVTSNPDNTHKNLPVINGNVLLLDEETGVLKAVIAATNLTLWRTAAASAVATHHLYGNLKQNHGVLAILGAGDEGRAHALAFEHFFNFKEIRIWNRTANKAKSLVEDLQSKLEVPEGFFKFFQEAEDCVREADVIVTATASETPIVLKDWVKEGALINAIGASRQGHHTELDWKIYQSGQVFIDHWEGAKSELPALIKSCKIIGEIGSVITGEALNVKPTANKITIFQSLGMAAEDCTMARMIFDAFVVKKQQT